MISLFAIDRVRPVSVCHPHRCRPPERRIEHSISTRSNALSSGLSSKTRIARKSRHSVRYGRTFYPTSHPLHTLRQSMYLRDYWLEHSRLPAATTMGSAVENRTFSNLLTDSLSHFSFLPFLERPSRWSRSSEAAAEGLWSYPSDPSRREKVLREDSSR